MSVTIEHDCTDRSHREKKGWGVGREDVGLKMNVFLSRTGKTMQTFSALSPLIIIVIIRIMYIYHALINALRAHIIHINLNTMFHTHVVESSPTKTI